VKDLGFAAPPNKRCHPERSEGPRVHSATKQTLSS
jgi:hypothetical protein